MHKVKKFSPSIYDDNDTMNSIYDVQENEIEKLNSNSKNIFDNNFVQSSDINGVKKFENILNIISDIDFDLEYRKQKVLDKLIYKPPFTRLRFQQILERIWGKGNFIFEIFPNEYEIVIDVDTDNINYYLTYIANVRDVIPANMYLILAIQYTYLYLNKNYTYEKLENQFTYEELSKYSKEVKNEIYG